MARVDPVERVLNVLSLLHDSPKPLTRAEIVVQMARGLTPYPKDEEAQRQLLTSDRRTIAVGIGVPVRQRVRGGSDAGQTEYWIDRADLQLPPLDLDDEERLVLSMALAAVSRSVPDAGEALLKLGPAAAPDSPFEFSVDVPEVVMTMIDAARSGSVVELAVPGGRFEFEPWAVMLDNATWVVVGHDVALDAPRPVRLDRLLADPVPVRRVRSAARPELDAVLLRSVVHSASESAPVVATVLVDEATAARASLSPRVRRRSQVDLFGVVELSVDVTDAARFRSWLLALGDRAELVAPNELRNDVIAWLRGVAAQEPSGSKPPPPPSTPAKRPGPEPVEVRLHRLLSIVPWLYQQRSAHITEIAARVGVSAQQVMRDLTLASMCGVPPYTSDVLYGFWVDPKEGMVNVIQPTLMTGPMRLTARQATAVGVALSALAALPGDTRGVVERLRHKLAAAIGEVPVSVAVDEAPLLDEIRTAAEQRRRVRIEYVDPDDNVTERVIDPQKLFVDRGTAYVVADDHLRGAERVFRVDRMLLVSPTDEHFQPRRITPPAGKQWSWMVPARDVVVRLPPGSDWVLERNATTASAIGGDGWLTVWVSVVSERWLAALLLRCGRGAEVLEPPEYVGLAARHACAALVRYG